MRRLVLGALVLAAGTAACSAPVGDGETAESQSGLARRDDVAEVKAQVSLDLPANLPPSSVADLSTGTVLAVVDAPVVTAPAAGATTGQNPTITWEPVAEATKYRLFINNYTGKNVLDKTLTAAEVCTGSPVSCSYTLDEKVPETLGTGGHKLYVRGEDDTSSGPWTTGTAFTANTFTRPGWIVPDANGYTSLTPLFRWSAGATGAFQLIVNDATGASVVNSVVTPTCSSGAGGYVCSYTLPAALLSGYHRAYVRQADTASGTYGEWSVGLGFWATIVTMPVATVAYGWTSIAGAVSYEVWVNRSPDGANVDNRIVTSTDAACGAGEFECQIFDTLPSGGYRFYVRAIDSRGVRGPWSAGFSFTK